VSPPARPRNRRSAVDAGRLRQLVPPKGAEVTGAVLGCSDRRLSGILPPLSRTMREDATQFCDRLFDYSTMRSRAYWDILGRTLTDPIQRYRNYGMME
jgi:hypothetical protein